MERIEIAALSKIADILSDNNKIVKRNSNF